MRIQDGRIRRPVEVLGREFLCFLAVKVLKIGLCHFGGAVLSCINVDQGHGRFCQNTDAGIDDFIFVGAIFLENQMGLVFPGNQHIAKFAFSKRHG